MTRQSSHFFLDLNFFASTSVTRCDAFVTHDATRDGTDRHRIANDDETIYTYRSARHRIVIHVVVVVITER